MNGEPIVCGSSDNLDLTDDPRVRAAARQALDTYGCSCTGSRFLNGDVDLHQELEQEQAHFLGNRPPSPRRDKKIPTELRGDLVGVRGGT
ncbi:hypothetical protein ACH46N_28225 [Streptomyces pristinaespiralis]|uniref:8-amino-7-oxononanoate synthase n=2 Tax=Streptomyces pristinaespiralis TaxID=38300 RepID=B5H9I2_STRE2|nr:hypothetical protein [Streptomyces pristinaespiralis]ALC24180.1 8-amino-7-oxononanoate synthase [Streptomyces pristinaespiralis]EDY63493.1 8-amino-7-oxononanoate synthase [Streptomyces pristinaespiralis ATCC 25486]QMU13438.1 hypothetical protein H3L99_07395 [Streptomyces pristinaespiralis]